ncbi:MAG: hypothetical protein Q9224_006820 [Gallowayella concinna]
MAYARSGPSSPTYREAKEPTRSLVRKSIIELLPLQKTANTTTRLTQTMPNPYRVPGKPYSLFFSYGDDSLPRHNIRACLSRAYGGAKWIIDRFGGTTPLPRYDYQPLRSTFYDVEFAFGRVDDDDDDDDDPTRHHLRPHRAHHELTYDDALDILEAFWLKAGESGMADWVAQIRMTGSGVHIGEASLWKNWEGALALKRPPPPPPSRITA